MTDEDFASEARRIVPCDHLQGCVHEAHHIYCSAWKQDRIALALRAARDRGFREGVEDAARKINVHRFAEYAVAGKRAEWQAAFDLEHEVRAMLSPPSSPEPSGETPTCPNGHGPMTGANQEFGTPACSACGAEPSWETCRTCKGSGKIDMSYPDRSEEDDAEHKRINCPGCSPRSPGTEGGGAKEEK